MQRWISFASALLLAGTAQAAVWTVDDSGGANFTTIQAAVNAAASGDVILVRPGTYAAFTITLKDLSVIGVPDAFSSTKPSVGGKSQILSVFDSTIANLRFNALVFQSVHGTGVVDDVIADTSLCEPGCRITSCPQMIVMRSTFEGKFGDINCETEGLFVESSTVNLTSCTLRGGPGGDDGACTGFHGQPGLRIGASSKVLMAGTSAFGGDGGDALFDCGFGGDGAPAIRFAGAGSSCIVRGNSTAILDGGSGGTGLSPGTSAQYAVDGTGALTISGVTWTPAALGPGISGSIPFPPQPFFTLTGGDTPGAMKSFSVFGPVGSAHLIYVTLGWADDFPFPPQLDGVYWLALPGPLVVFPMTGAGQSVASSLSWSLPASFASLHGVVANFQGSTQGMGAGGKYLAGNPTQHVIR